MLKTTGNRRNSYWMPLLVLILLLAALAGSMLDYASHNERLTKDDIYKTLGEAAKQQLMLLDTKLDDLFSCLELMAGRAVFEDGEPGAELMDTMDRSMELYSFRTMGLIDAATGVAHLRSGERYDASERGYFTGPLQGERTVEYIEDNVVTGEPVFILSLPVYDGDRVSAVLFAGYDAQVFAELLEAMAFDGRSYSYITDLKGNIIIGPNHSSALVSSGSLLAFTEKGRLEDGVTTELIAGHMKDGEPFTFSVASGGSERYVSVMPAGINDWVLFYVATDDVAAERTYSSAYLVYILALKLLVIFTVFALILWRYERRRQRDILLREEELRVAAGQSEKLIMRYDIQRKTVSAVAGNIPGSAAMQDMVEDVPESFIKAGLISKESVEELRGFFAALKRGEPEGAATVRMAGGGVEGRWFHMDYTLVSGERKARYAVITLQDVTKLREQESIYEKWRQSIRDRAPESYTLFHCNIGRETSMDKKEGSLLDVAFEPGVFEFDSRTGQYASRLVLEEDREKFAAFLTTDAMLSDFYHGKRIVSLDYREKAESGFRWIRLTVELVEQPHSSDIEVYLLFEDIDAQKRAELDILERAQTDPLTGLLNRAAFEQEVDGILCACAPERVHALLMLDIDDFKQVNDLLGHGEGDKVLVGIAELLSAGTRRGDIVGRLGGDEFMVFLPDISDGASAAKKARQICEAANRTLESGARVSVSIGVALCPRDGDSFAALYKKSDEALYRAKGSGKNNCVLCG